MSDPPVPPASRDNPPPARLAAASETVDLELGALEATLPPQPGRMPERELPALDPSPEPARQP